MCGLNLWKPAHVIPLEVFIENREQVLRIRRSEFGRSPAQNLDVLLRHRLAAHPGTFARQGHRCDGAGRSARPTSAASRVRRARCPRLRRRSSSSRERQPLRRFGWPPRGSGPRRRGAKQSRSTVASSAATALSPDPSRGAGVGEAVERPGVKHQPEVEADVRLPKSRHVAVSRLARRRRLPEPVRGHAPGPSRRCRCP